MLYLYWKKHFIIYFLFPVTIVYLWLATTFSQPECVEKTILRLLFPEARGSVASKCAQDIAGSVELIRYAGLWRRSWLNSFLRSPCMILYNISLQNAKRFFVYQTLQYAQNLDLFFDAGDARIRFDWTAHTTHAQWARAWIRHPLAI